MRESKTNKSICWNCKNNCGGCEWSADFSYVKNWEINSKKIKNSKKSLIIVKSCPKYEQRFKFENFADILKTLSEYFSLNLQTIKQSLYKYGAIYEMEKELLPKWFWYYKADLKKIKNK